MIRDLVKGLNKTERENNIFSDKYVCGCIYRSFNQLQANLFFRFTTEQRRMNSSQIKEIFLKESKDKVNKALKQFMDIGFLKNLGNYLELSRQFAVNVQKYIMNPEVLSPINLNQYSQNLKKLVQPSPSSFLQLLFQPNRIPSKCQFKPLHGNITAFGSKLSRNQFNFIKSSISTKIGLLIQGILKEGNKQKNIKSIVKLNLLSPNHFYQCSELNCLDSILDGLEKINLVQRSGKNRQLIQISKYLYHYTFEEKIKNHQDQYIYPQFQKHRQYQSLTTESFCNINVIIQTNFKVYTTIESSSETQKKILKDILGYLLSIDHDTTDIQEMIIGQIREATLREKVFSQGITAAQYFDFFKQYMKISTKISAHQKDTEQEANKELGKWKKLRFLGLDGPQSNSMIPSNVRQEVKLWEKLYQQKQQMGDDNY